MRILAGLFVALVLVGGGLVASGAVQVTVGAPAAPAAAAAAVPSVPAALRQQLASVDEALARARQGGAPIAITLTFSEADLQASVAAAFPQTAAGITFSEPAIRLVAGQIVLGADASASILRSRATIAATPQVAAGRPTVRVDSVGLGTFPVPDQLREAIAGQLAAAIGAIVPARVSVTAITVTDGKLAVAGLASP